MSKPPKSGCDSLLIPGESNFVWKTTSGTSLTSSVELSLQWHPTDRAHETSLLSEMLFDTGTINNVSVSPLIGLIIYQAKTQIRGVVRLEDLSMYSNLMWRIIRIIYVFFSCALPLSVIWFICTNYALRYAGRLI